MYHCTHDSTTSRARLKFLLGRGKVLVEQRVESLGALARQCVSSALEQLVERAGHVAAGSGRWRIDDAPVQIERARGIDEVVEIAGDDEHPRYVLGDLDELARRDLVRAARSDESQRTNAQNGTELAKAPGRRLPAREVEASEVLGLETLATRPARILRIVAVKVGGRKERVGDQEDGLLVLDRAADQLGEHDQAAARRQIVRVAGLRR